MREFSFEGDRDSVFDKVMCAEAFFLRKKGLRTFGK